MRIKTASQRKGVVADYIPWLIIGLAVLVIVMIAVFLLRGQGESFIDKIKSLFRGV
jgi:hypothetical protein